jgi:hypothetical protein
MHYDVGLSTLACILHRASSSCSKRRASFFILYKSVLHRWFLSVSIASALYQGIIALSVVYCSIISCHAYKHCVLSLYLITTVRTLTKPCDDGHALTTTQCLVATSSTIPHERIRRQVRGKLSSAADQHQRQHSTGNYGPPHITTDTSQCPNTSL